VCRAHPRGRQPRQPGSCPRRSASVLVGSRISVGNRRILADRRCPGSAFKSHWGHSHRRPSRARQGCRPRAPVHRRREREGSRRWVCRRWLRPAVVSSFSRDCGGSASKDRGRRCHTHRSMRAVAPRVPSCTAIRRCPGCIRIHITSMFDFVIVGAGSAGVRAREPAERGRAHGRADRGGTARAAPVQGPRAGGRNRSCGERRSTGRSSRHRSATPTIARCTGPGPSCSAERAASTR
jgi:hypothetical protein